MAITLVGQAGVGGGNFTSPQSISYNLAAAGNTAIITGYFLNTSNGSDFPVSVTDNSGVNVWQVSTGNATNPPTQQISSGGSVWTAFVAWCIDAASFGTVTISRQDTASNWWRVTLSEWSGIVALDSANAGTGASSTTFATPSVTLSNSGDLVVAAIAAAPGNSLSLPAGWTQFTNLATQGGYIVPGTTGSYSANWTDTGADIWGGAVAAFTPAGSPGPVGNPAGGPWTAAFADEFGTAYPTPSGTGPNPAVWADHLLEGDYWRTNGDASQVDWGPHNKRGFSQSGSVLTITARHESPYTPGTPGYDPQAPNPLPSGNAATYTSGYMNSKPGFSMSYGYFESRLRFSAPNSPGAWPSFWMRVADRFWPPEIDIQEYNASGLEQEGSTYIPVSPGPVGGPYTPPGTIDYTQFHVYGVRVLPSGIQFFMDGSPFGTAYTNATYLTGLPWVITYNLAVRKDGAGYPNLAGYPATMDIDYARAWTITGVPAQPVIASVSPANGIPTAGTLTVTFSPLSGATTYRATPCPADGGTGTSQAVVPATRQAVTGSGSPLTMTGLTNGYEYVVTVAGINATGYSIESAPVPSLAPAAAPAPLTLTASDTRAGGPS